MTPQSEAAEIHAAETIASAATFDDGRPMNLDLGVAALRRHAHNVEKRFPPPLLRTSERIRAGRRGRPSPPSVCPPNPFGVKFELTERCNLLCGFCYTDSPAKTAAGAVDLDADLWDRLIDESIDLGILEAVVTGGEPFLRRDLALRLLERLTTAGVWVTCNTNGWFLDQATVNALAALSRLTINVSVDGDEGRVHDAARGVPASWKRAIEAIDRCLAAGVRVQVVHVITEDNEDRVSMFLDAMFSLGVDDIRLAIVGSTGRTGRTYAPKHTYAIPARIAAWGADHPGVKLAVTDGDFGPLDVRRGVAPRAMLVRGDGSVRVASNYPFAFGTVQTESLGEIWHRMTTSWDAEEIAAWELERARGPLRESSSLRPYIDGEKFVGGAVPVTITRSPKRRAAEARHRQTEGDDAAWLRSLALRRPWAVADYRATSTAVGHTIRLLDSGELVELNHSGWAVLRSIAETGDAAVIVERLTSQHGAAMRSTIELDVCAVLHQLRHAGVLRPRG